MDFSFTAEQRLLRDTVRRWARSLNSDGLHRAVIRGEEVDLEALWKHVADAGWVGFAVPVELGGAGGSLLEACIVLEEVTATLLPIPYAGNAVLVPALLRGAHSDLLRSIADGTTRVAPLLAEDLSWMPGSGDRVAWDWWPGDTLLVPGSPPTVVAPTNAGGYQSVDLLRPMGHVRVPQSAGAPLDEPSLRHVTAVSRVAAAAALVGLMEGALEATVRHAGSRHQFGRAIGSFQAVQHMCADMLVDLEAARSVAYAAAWTLANGTELRGERMAAMAKAWCAPAAIRVCEQAIQIHGGLGITWEADAHLYLRGAHLWAAAFGPTSGARLDVAAGLIDEAARGAPVGA